MGQAPPAIGPELKDGPGSLIGFLHTSLVECLLQEDVSVTYDIHIYIYVYTYTHVYAYLCGT